MDRLSITEIKYLKGVGEERAKLLASELDIHTFRDLLYFFPFRYVDRSRFYMISELSGMMPAVQVRGRFVRFTEEGEGAKRRLIGLFTDGKSMMENKEYFPNVYSRKGICAVWQTLRIQGFRLDGAS